MTDYEIIELRRKLERQEQEILKLTTLLNRHKLIAIDLRAEIERSLETRQRTWRNMERER
jgi:hypothetical protein